MRAIFHRSSTLKKAKDAKKILDSVLEATEKALSSIPIPGARAAIGKLLAIMPALEVCSDLLLRLLALVSLQTLR